MFSASRSATLPLRNELLISLIMRKEFCHARTAAQPQLRLALVRTAHLANWRHGAHPCLAFLCLPAHRLAGADRPDVYCRNAAADSVWLAGRRLCGSLGSALD